MFELNVDVRPMRTRPFQVQPRDGQDCWSMTPSILAVICFLHVASSLQFLFLITYKVSSVVHYKNQ